MPNFFHRSTKSLLARVTTRALQSGHHNLEFSEWDNSTVQFRRMLSEEMERMTIKIIDILNVRSMALSRMAEHNSEISMTISTLHM
jgi:hypothetical protein